MTRGPLPASEPSAQYHEISLWYRSPEGKEALKQQEAFWTKALANPPDLVSFPPDRPRASAPVRTSIHLSVPLPSELGEGLTRLAREESATLFAALFAAFNVLLSRSSDQTDLPVGILVANRNLPGAGGVIGKLANPVVARSDLSGNPPFIEVLARAQETLSSVLANQELPFGRVIGLLKPPIGPLRPPFFCVLFNVDNFDLPPRIGELELSVASDYQTDTVLDVAFTVMRYANGHRLNVEYSPELFDAATIRRLLAQYEALLRAVLADRSLRVGDIPIGLAGERRAAASGRDEHPAVELEEVH